MLLESVCTNETGNIHPLIAPARRVENKIKAVTLADYEKSQASKKFQSTVGFASYVNSQQGLSITPEQAKLCLLVSYMMQDIPVKP